MEYSIDQKDLDEIETVLQDDLMRIGVHCAILIDLAGNIIVSLDTGNKRHDIYSLAALAAGNFGAVNEMARMVGEEDFSLLFHKGKKGNIHFSRVSDDFLLVTTFGEDISLGFLRLKVNEAIEKITKTISD